MTTDMTWNTTLNVPVYSGVTEIRTIEFLKNLDSYGSAVLNLLLPSNLSLRDIAVDLQKEGYNCIRSNSNLYFHNKSIGSIIQLMTISYGNSFDEFDIGGLRVQTTFYINDPLTLNDFVNSFMEKFSLTRSERNVNANWAFWTGQDIKSRSVPIKPVKDFHDEFYPSVGNVNDYISDFLKSEQNILILNGDPGTGKSTFLKHFLYHTDQSVTITYDEFLMGYDRFYIDFVMGSDKILVLEDADLVIGSRERDGNKIMSKILNISDGIIEVPKKIIFTANLHSLADIDPALTRPGRCFDVLQFDLLSRQQAEIAAAKIGKTLVGDKREYTVAEIYNSKNNEENVVHLNRMGFN